MKTIAEVFIKDGYTDPRYWNLLINEQYMTSIGLKLPLHQAYTTKARRNHIIKFKNV